MQLTRENYFSKEAQMEYTGASQIKAFLKCPACAKAELLGEWEREPSDALTVGSFMDALFGTEEERALFEMQNKVYKKDGEPYQKFADAIKAYERAKSDPVFYDLCANGDGQSIMTGELQGIPFKVMFDNVHSTYLVDRKYMRSIDTIYDESVGQRVSFAEYYGYLYQAALYQTAFLQNTGEKRPFILCVITKEKEPRLEVFKVSDESIENALGVLRANIERIDAIKKGLIEAPRCEECAYCISTKVTSRDENTWRVV